MTNKNVSLQQVKDAASAFLRLDDDILIEVVLATYAANRLQADPLWVFVVSPPSTGKTEVLMAFDSHPGAKVLSSLTANSLISGKTGPSAKDMSRLPQLSGKLVIFKDFTSVLTQRREARNEVFGQLRETFDGRLSKSFGNEAGFREWTGKVGVLAAVTPEIDKHRVVTQLLGERFLYFRPKTDNAEEIAASAVENAVGIESRRREFRRLFCEFLARFDGMANTEPTIETAMADRLAKLALVCAVGRSNVLRARDSQAVLAAPEPEGPARLAKQLKLLALGLAMVRGRASVDEGVYAVVQKVARDGIPYVRFTVLTALWSAFATAATVWQTQEGDRPWFRTRDIISRAGLPDSTVRLELEDISLLGLAERKEDPEDARAKVWRPSRRLLDWVCTCDFLPVPEIPPGCFPWPCIPDWSDEQDVQEFD